MNIFLMTQNLPFKCFYINRLPKMLFLLCFKQIFHRYAYSVFKQSRMKMSKVYPSKHERTNMIQCTLQNLIEKVLIAM